MNNPAFPPIVNLGSSLPPLDVVPKEPNHWIRIFGIWLTIVVIGGIGFLVYFYAPFCRKCREGASKKQADSGKKSQTGETTTSQSTASSQK